MFTLPALGYAYDALEDYISKDIMELHHTKHHQTYVDKLNAALADYPDLQGKDIVTLLSDLDAIPEAIRTAVRNHGGGHYNHSFFWQCMAPSAGGEPSGELGDALRAKYGDFESFKTEFNTKAAGVFGSGWVWLTPDLDIITSPNQDSPLMNGGAEPILGLDVWEHAYYLDYKNKRDEYAKAWWNVVNWDFVSQRFADT
jgi:superoxide dismutase, Fe-Mn family